MPGGGKDTLIPRPEGKVCFKKGDKLAKTIKGDLTTIGIIFPWENWGRGSSFEQGIVKHLGVQSHVNEKMETGTHGGGEKGHTGPSLFFDVTSP